MQLRVLFLFAVFTMKQMKRSTDSVFALTTTYLDAIIVVIDLESTRAARSTEAEGM